MMKVQAESDPDPSLQSTTEPWRRTAWRGEQFKTRTTLCYTIFRRVRTCSTWSIWRENPGKVLSSWGTSKSLPSMLLWYHKGQALSLFLAETWTSMRTLTNLESCQSFRSFPTSSKETSQKLNPEVPTFCAKIWITIAFTFWEVTEKLQSLTTISPWQPSKLQFKE